MPNKDYCDITVVLDRSGSMQSVKTDTEGGFNQFVDEQKELPGICKLTLAQFDTEYEIVYRGRAIAEVPKLNLVPRGGTALLDAIGRTINEVGSRFKSLPESKRPGKVIFVILTDGEENSSHEFKRAKIFQMISHQQDRYQWEFVFLGANQDAIQTGTSLGIASSNNLTYGATAQGMNNAFASISRNTTAYRGGTSSTMGFTKQDEEDQEDALKQ